MRLTLNEEEYLTLKKLIIQTSTQNPSCVQGFSDEDWSTLEIIAQRIEKTASKPITEKKRNATKEATRKRIQEAKNKISNAVNMMRFENKTITISSIAQEAGVSYNTVKKYKDSINEIASCS
jgi:Fic family protein